MKNLLRLSTFMLLIALTMGSYHQAEAQENAISLHLDRVDVTAYPNITVHLSAWDESGLPLAGLTPENFTLQEDGGAAFHPAAVQADAEAPLSVVLVLDISGSMAGQPLADAKAAAARFLDRLAASDRAALIAFSAPVSTDPNDLEAGREMAFTADLAPMYDLIEKLEAGGMTHLYNAAAKAVQMIAELPVGHRAILLLSDGRNEPANEGEPDEAIQLARGANVPVFVIGLGDQVDEPYLRRLANETGGLFRAAPKSSELARLFTDMAALLKTQYILTYTSSLEADGRNHTLAITLNAASASTNASLEFGPLPSAPAPVAPTKTTAPIVPATSAPLSTPAPTATPPPPETFRWQDYGGGPIAALVALGLGIWLTSLRRRRPKPRPEVCAQCGFDLTGKPGACPQCGGTKRLPKR